MDKVKEKESMQREFVVLLVVLSRLFLCKSVKRGGEKEKERRKKQKYLKSFI